MSGASSSSIADLLSSAASVSPNEIWLTTPETEQGFSWQGSLDRATEIACYLQGAGLSDGASVAIASANGAAASFAFIGTVFGGYRATPLNLVAGVKTLGFVLSHSKTEIILCADDCRSMVEDGLAAMPDAPDTMPQIVSMDIDQGPRWEETEITPINKGRFAPPKRRQHWPIDVHIGNHRRAKRGFVVACQFDCSGEAMFALRISWTGPILPCVFCQFIISMAFA
jgi:acyl-CoA synthetase (AMP-forming)/AMP-acid ligase II